MSIEHHTRPAALATALIAAAITATSMAQAPQPVKGGYPERPIRRLIAQAPGGNADIIARALAEGMAKRLGQNVVPDNRPGASGIIATEMTVRAAPDDYTVVLVPATFTTYPSLARKSLFGPVKDFAPISLVSFSPLMPVVHPALPVKSVRELVALAKALL